MKQIQYFPLRICLSFLILTEILFWLGPNKYNITNNAILAIYLGLMNIALYYGYKIGVKKFRPSYFQFSSRSIKILLTIGLVGVYRNLVNNWADHGLDLTLSNLINSISNPGEAYLSFQDIGYNSSFFDIIFLSFFRIIAIPLGICKWEKLNKPFKVIVLITIILQIINYLGIGVRKGLLDIMLYVFFILTAKNIRIITDPKIYRKVKIISATVIFLFLFYFVFSIASRYGHTFKEMQNLTGTEPRQFYVDNFPGWVVFAFQSITSYLCQGYYALAEALQMGIRKIVMFSDNWVSVYYCQKFLGYNPMVNTYMADLEILGIDMRVNWHSMYLWVANQFSFIGVPFVIFGIGYFFAQTWNDAIHGKNTLSYIVFSFFIVMVFYMFANNQVLSDSATSFWLWFIIYLVNKRNLV